jgi:hypothetical protein
MDYFQAVALCDLINIAVGMDDVAIFRGADETPKR